MIFKVYDEVFEKLPDLCFGVVVAKDIDNSREMPEIFEYMKESMANLQNELKDKDLKEYDKILPYRESFKTLDINANKFMSSIEAMAKRVAKGNILPSINPIVDLGNSLSLKYVLPMGAHDMDVLEDEISVRFSVKGDVFTPLGTDEIEILEAGELVYADAKRIRTRRWIWRQSNIGCITESSKNIFFPIDGFTSSNKETIVCAMNELNSILKDKFNCNTIVGFIDKNNKVMKI